MKNWIAFHWFDGNQFRLCFAKLNLQSLYEALKNNVQFSLLFHCTVFSFCISLFHNIYWLLYYHTVMVLKTLLLQNPRNITHVLLCLFCRTSLESWFYFNILQVSLSKYGVIVRIWLCLIDVKWPSSQDSPYQRSKFLSHVFLFWSWFNFHSQL